MSQTRSHQRPQTSYLLLTQAPQEAHEPAAHETPHGKHTSPTAAVGNAGQLSPPQAEHKVHKGSTHSSKVPAHAPERADHHVGVIGVTPESNTKSADSHDGKSGDVHSSELPKPFADDTLLQYPVTGETLDTDNTAKVAEHNTEGQHRQHVTIAEPQGGSKRTSTTGAAENSELGHHRDTYSVGNTSGETLELLLHFVICSVAAMLKATVVLHTMQGSRILGKQL